MRVIGRRVKFLLCFPGGHAIMEQRMWFKMKTMLVSGGTVFVSRYAAEYFAARGWRVSVMNRGSREQPAGVEWICADRHELGERLRGRRFDAVLDITAYTARDVSDLLDALGDYGAYILISSSAVYPESGAQPFREDAPTGPNAFWGAYGTDKIAAEEMLLRRDKAAYILRPPYLYGPGNNVYREAFVFDCALQDRPFFLPGDGGMPLQFFHVKDLCRVMEALLDRQPRQRVFNVGNPDCVTVREWVEMGYAALGKTPRFVSVPGDVPQRAYFPFHDYAYALDVSAQAALLPETMPIPDGLAESLAWYVGHEGEVRKKEFISFIDAHLP